MTVSELKTAMDAQFAEVKGQFGKVEERFRALDQRVATVDDRLASIDQQFAEVRAQFEAVDRRFDAVDSHITTEAIDTRRHFDVVAEQMKADIALLAGAVVAATASLEGFIAAGRSERTTVTAALDDHEVRLTVLERRRV